MNTYTSTSTAATAPGVVEPIPVRRPRNDAHASQNTATHSFNINKHVCIATAQEVQRQGDKQRMATPGFQRGGFRDGTIYATLQAFAARIGDPHLSGDRSDWYNYDKASLCDGRVSAQWHLSTPRGLVTVQDWWLNDHGTLSIGTNYTSDRRATLWAVRWLRDKGIDSELLGAKRGHPCMR